MTAASAVGEAAKREVYLDRRVCTIQPDRIDIHPARGLVVLPLLTLVTGLGAFPLIYFWGGSLSLELRFILTLAALVLVPVSGVGLVYSIAGAHLVLDRAKQSAVLQQGYLGMGVGTQELIPFWKIDRIIARELAGQDERGQQRELAQFEVVILKLSGREIPVGSVTVRRADAADGLQRASEVAALIAAICGSTVAIQRQRETAGVPV